MSRFKFRAWDRKSKKMRAVDSIAFNNQNSYGNYNPDHLPKVVNVWGWDIIEEKHIILHRDAKGVDIMQWTGLQDKNGKDIYEGDMLNDDTSKSMVVCYGEYVAGVDAWNIKYVSTGWYVKFQDGGYYSMSQEAKGYCIKASECEVVGNIYENPELLKV